MNPSAKSNSAKPAIKQQILRQIYISVNTYNDSKIGAIKADDPSATKTPNTASPGH